jgi:predicted small lipoprotein YifL
MQHMKKVLKSMACLAGAAALLSLAGCGGDDKGTPPAELRALTAEGLPGQILLKWSLPSEADNIHQVKVTYYDHRLKMDVMRVASAYAEGMEIPETRARYGSYTFTVQPFSRDAEGTAQTVAATSGPAPKRWIMGNISDTVKIPLVEASLYTNAQEPSEGPVKNLLDDDKSTFFHTVWSSGKWATDASRFLGDKHYLQVDLGRVLSAGDYFSFYYAPRNNDNNKPTDFDLYGSIVGDTIGAENDWFLVKNFTKADDNLPDNATTEYYSPILSVATPLQFIRLSVNSTNNDAEANGAKYWTMSEFKVWTYKAEIKEYDPETEEEEL